MSKRLGGEDRAEEARWGVVRLHREQPTSNRPMLTEAAELVLRLPLRETHRKDDCARSRVGRCSTACRTSEQRLKMGRTFWVRTTLTSSFSIWYARPIVKLDLREKEMMRGLQSG